jgi:hypothetical protein
MSATQGFTPQARLAIYRKAEPAKTGNIDGLLAGTELLHG